MYRLARQGGVALLVVMALLASAAFLAANQLHTQQRGVKLATNQAMYSQGLWYALAMEEWAKIVLEQDRQSNTTDSLSDAWANLEPAFDIAEGVMFTELEDAQSRLNLNSLRKTGEGREVALQRLKNLLSMLRMDPDLAVAAADWIDPDLQPTGFAGAEDDYYARLSPPRLAANAPLEHPAELLSVKGMSAGDFAALDPFVSALDAEATINVNTASRELLLVLGLSTTQADLVLAERAASPFLSVQDFVSRLQTAFDEAFSVEGLGVASDYFLLTTRVVIGGVPYAQRSLISRRGTQYRVEWRVRLLPGARIDA
jgi:general secretion pathway protein K